MTRPAAAALALSVGLSLSANVAAQQRCDGQPSLPPARFQDNGDGTVTDRQSNLMWMRCAGGQRWLGQRCVGTAQTYAWADARRHAEDVSRGGAAFFNDWRVPALAELATITDRSCRNPRTSLTVFPDTPAAAFWSSTMRPGEAGSERALGLSFGIEGVRVALREERFHVRLVRSGP